MRGGRVIGVSWRTHRAGREGAAGTPGSDPPRPLGGGLLDERAEAPRQHGCVLGEVALGSRDIGQARLHQLDDVGLISRREADELRQDHYLHGSDRDALRQRGVAERLEQELPRLSCARAKHPIRPNVAEVRRDQPESSPATVRAGRGRGLRRGLRPVTRPGLAP